MVPFDEKYRLGETAVSTTAGRGAERDEKKVCILVDKAAHVVVAEKGRDGGIQKMSGVVGL